MDGFKPRTNLIRWTSFLYQLEIQWPTYCITINRVSHYHTENHLPFTYTWIYRKGRFAWQFRIITHRIGSGDVYHGIVYSDSAKGYSPQLTPSPGWGIANGLSPFSILNSAKREFVMHLSQTRTHNSRTILRGLKYEEESVLYGLMPMVTENFNHFATSGQISVTCLIYAEPYIRSTQYKQQNVHTSLGLFWWICHAITRWWNVIHYSDMMSAMASQITSFSIIYCPVCSGADQREHQSFVSHAFLGESIGDRLGSLTRGR